MKQLLFTIMAFGGFITSAHAQHVNNHVQFDPRGSHGSLYVVGDGIHVSSSQRPDRLRQSVFFSDAGGHTMSETFVRRQPDGTLYGNQWNMRIGQDGSYFGSGQIGGAHEIEIRSQTDRFGGSMQIGGRSFHDGPVRTQLYQKSYR